MWDVQCHVPGCTVGFARKFKICNAHIEITSNNWAINVSWQFTGFYKIGF